MSEQHISPCKTCPFRRDVEPGNLGGSPVTTYVGQTEAGFAIPCHSCIDFDDPDWNAKARVPGAVHQCAGAAIFRSNIGKPVHRSMLVLGCDEAKVFSSHAEFVAHHLKIPLLEAQCLMDEGTVQLCVDQELRRAGVSVHLIPKPEQQ